jgi:hypothetical protein
MPLPTAELGAAAPPIYDEERDVTFPFSNDNMRTSFVDALSRKDTETYQAVENPVAVLVGESALAANIQLIPEQTIVLIDKNHSTSLYLDRYVQALREEPDAASWMQRMLGGFASDLSAFTFRDCLARQIRHFRDYDRVHPFGDTTQDAIAYSNAQEKAREKTIVSWAGNIASPDDMEYLGETLREHNGTVTLLNLTNVIPYCAERPHLEHSYLQSRRYAEVLRTLPTTADMPILTTSSYSYDVDPTTTAHMLDYTGPFTGLDDLAARGGNGRTGPINGSPLH